MSALSKYLEATRNARQIREAALLQRETAMDAASRAYYDTVNAAYDLADSLYQDALAEAKVEAEQRTAQTEKGD